MPKITFIITFSAYCFNLSAQEGKTSQVDIKYLSQSINFDHEVVLPFEETRLLKSNFETSSIEIPIKSTQKNYWQASYQTPFSKKEREAGSTMNYEYLLFLEKSDPNRSFALIQESK